jgi:hypothetical protein
MTTISAISGPTETTTTAVLPDMTIDPELSISSSSEDEHHHRAILATRIQGCTRIASPNVDQTKGTMVVRIISNFVDEIMASVGATMVVVVVAILYRPAVKHLIIIFAAVVLLH